MYSGVAGEGWQPWDYAAGWLFIEEAGGIVTQVSTGGGLFCSIVPAALVFESEALFSRAQSG